MTKIWIVVGLAGALALAGCGGGEKEAPKQAAESAQRRRRRLHVQG